MSDYRKLSVWKAAHEFVLEVYRITAGFPNEEKYGLTSQLRRAAASIPTNIVEGKGSNYDRKLVNFIDIAKSSAQEVEYLLLLSKDLEYLDVNTYNKLHEECLKILKMLTAFRKSVYTNL